LVSATVLAVPAARLAAVSVAAAQESPVVGTVQTPNWTFTVVAVDDPYKGEVTRPKKQAPGTRYVSAQVVITNGSDEPLQFDIVDVRLVDQDGIEYPAGDVTGSEPKLVAQNLPDGERTRGWVWYSLPTDAKVNEVRFYGPRPVFRIKLNISGEKPASS
jgi:uncharacterized protein DUF4352